MNDTTTDGAMRVASGMAVEELTRERMVEITAEMRAMELVAALRNTIAGTSHWRLEAQNLLVLVENGIPPRLQHPVGIFRDHRCWKCNDGQLPCVQRNANQCEYPHARND
jgi:hypothetical protein